MSFELSQILRNCNLIKGFFRKRVVAILPYSKMPDTDELSFQKGDIFFVHNDMGDGWIWVSRDIFQTKFPVANILLITLGNETSNRRTRNDFL